MQHRDFVLNKANSSILFEIRKIPLCSIDQFSYNSDDFGEKSYVYVFVLGHVSFAQIRPYVSICLFLYSVSLQFHITNRCRVTKHQKDNPNKIDVFGEKI